MATESIFRSYEEPAIATSSDHSINHSIDHFDDNIHVDNMEVKTLAFPADVSVPIIANLSSPESSEISLGTSHSPAKISAPTGITENTTVIKWNAADLNYLVGILYPEQTLENRLLFSPPLEDLENETAPIHLQLFVRMPGQTIAPEAYSRHAAIGTGRPISKLLHESDISCKSAASARRSMAQSMLKDWRVISAICTKYTVMSALYSLPCSSLGSVYRGMQAMATVSEVERSERLGQLWGLVDSKWEFEPRLESYLLEAGIVALPGWLECVEIGLVLSVENREAWAGVYGAVGKFLREACEGL